MSLQLDLKGADLRDVVAAAIMQHLDTVKREELIRAAIGHLITPPESPGYGNPRYPSPLQAAFNDAVGRIARDIIGEELQKPEHRERFEGVVRDAMVKAFDGDRREKMIGRMADALSSVASGDR